MSRMERFYTILGWIAAFYMFALFLFPLFKVVTSSVWVQGQFTWQNYTKIFLSEVYTKILIKTLWVSFVSTFVALILGYLLAYFIVRRPKKTQGFWLMVVIAPMFMSLTVRLFGWMILLGKEGPIASVFRGLMKSGQEFSVLFSSSAVIIGIVHFVLPFVVLNIYTSLQKLNPAVLEASTMLGASEFRTFWKVTFPLSLPGVFAGGSIAFALSASTFLVPTMLGGPSDNLLSNLAYNAIVTIGNTGLGSALSMVLLIIVVVVLVIMGIMEKRWSSF